MAREEFSSKADLLKAAEAAVTTPSGPSPEPRRQGGTRWSFVGVGLLAVALTGGWVLGTRPEWVFPPAPTVESPEVTVASMRMVLVRERQRVERYRQEHGRLPQTLAEAGGHLPNVEIAHDADGGYLLRAVEGATALELHSSETLETFLGNSLQVLLNARREP